jgi:excisionase family DNA binding protein
MIAQTANKPNTSQIADSPRRKSRQPFTPTVEPLYLRVSEAAQLLSISRSALYLLMDRGELPYSKFGRCRRVPKLALEAYQRRCLVGSISAE